jgi:trehalose synthase
VHERDAGERQPAAEGGDGVVMNLGAAGGREGGMQLRSSLEDSGRVRAAGWSRQWRSAGARGRAGQATESAVAGCGSERSRGFDTQGTPPSKRGAVGLAVLRSGNTQPMLEMVEVPPHPPERFESVLEPEPFEKLADGIRAARELLGERTIWNVSSTAKGGGVVELLLPLIGYAKGAGVDARWAVIEGNPEFFKVTKRIHNFLHGFEGDGGALDDAARKVYEDALEPNARELVDLVAADDVVLLHDPQTAGLIGPLKRTGAKVIWRCHIGIDEPNDIARAGWDFLRVDVDQADAYVFSREGFVWEGLDDAKVAVIAPSIDAFNAKNQELEAAQVEAILAAAGIVDGGDGEPTFARGDGSEARVTSQAQIFEDVRLTPADPVVLQVSRWDHLKDPAGVIRGFAEHGSAHETGAHLIYAGPAVDAVSDDPEGAQVLQEAIELRESLSDEARRNVHLVCLPMDDAEENAVIVNALQRNASVVVQKSIAEGFGLTVAEAMWKGRPIVATRVGGIQDQVVDGESGVLLADARDLDAYGDAVRGLLEDPERARKMGEAAQQRVRSQFLGARSLIDYLGLIARVLA